MPNGGTKTHAGDGSPIAPDDKALDEKGLYGKPGREDAVRQNRRPEKNGQQTERP